MNKEFEKMRAEFEDWYSALIGKTANLMRNDAYYDRPRYGNAKTDIAWLAWQASRKQAVGECAAVCDKINDDEWHAFKKAPLDDQRRGGDYTQGKSDGAADCADAIRALQKE